MWVGHWRPPPIIHSDIKHPNKYWQTVPPDNFITTIYDIIQRSPHPPSRKKIFEISNAAATHNNYILQSHNFDMTRTIAANHNSHISYRSEFRTVEVLEPLLQKIPLWKSVSEILVKGAKYPLERINSSRQKSDLEESLQWWNHQSAKKDPSILTKLIQKDVNAGFQLPTTTNSLHKMPHTCIAP